MIYATGHICGAHFNPAVTLAFSFTRHFPKTEILPYIVAQCFGAITASTLHLLILEPILQKTMPNQTLNFGVTQPIDNSFLTALVLEFFLTFFLMFVIMAVATDYRAVGQAAGAAIGGTVCFDALFAGPLSGASMNPARSLAPAIAAARTEYLWLYLVAPVLGAGAAVVACRYSRGEGCCT